MKNINKELDRYVKLAEKSKHDPDEASWAYQIGVLLSVNQAKQLLEALPENWQDNDKLKNDYTELICDRILSWDGVGVFGSAKMQQIAERLKQPPFGA